MKVPKKAIITGAAVAGILAAGAAVAASDAVIGNMRVQTMYGPIAPVYQDGGFQEMLEEHLGVREDM